MDNPTCNVPLSQVGTLVASPFVVKPLLGILFQLCGPKSSTHVPTAPKVRRTCNWMLSATIINTYVIRESKLELTFRGGI